MNGGIPSPAEMEALKRHLFKQYGVRSEKELMQKVLGTSDRQEVKRILTQRLSSMPNSDPLVREVKSRLGGQKKDMSLEKELIKSLTPEQKRRLKQYLKKRQR